MEIEDISGVSLTTWWTSEQERHLSVGHSLLGQVVKDDDSVHAVVSEEFSHSYSRVWGQVLQGGSVRGGGRDHNGVPGGIKIY